MDATLVGKFRALVAGRAIPLLLAALTLLALALRVVRIAHDLPYPFQKDCFQIELAADLLKNGSFTINQDYPLGLVYLYATAAWVAWVVQCALGASSSWTEYVERFADPAVHQIVGRAVSAVFGALLVPATYALARVACSRGVAMLAAALVAVDAAHVLIDHQVRPHPAAITLLVFALPLALRAARDPGRNGRDAVVAGIALGLGALVFQSGWLGAGWIGLLALAWVRPAKRLASTLGGLAAGFLVGWGPLNALMNLPHVAIPPQGSRPLDATSTLSLPVRMLEWFDFRRIPAAALNWLWSSPALFLAAGAFACACLVRRRATDRSLLLVYATYPLLVFVTMTLFLGTQARYSLAATPFLAVLAAAGCLALPGRKLRALAAAALLAVGLTGSARFLQLLGTVNTRLSAARLLPQLSERHAVTMLSTAILVDPRALPFWVVLLPPIFTDGPSRYQPDFSPLRELRKSRATVFLRGSGTPWEKSGPLDAETLELLGFRLYGTIESGRLDANEIYLPELPDHYFEELLSAHRMGPPIQIWATDDGRRILESVVPAELVADWKGCADSASAVSALLAERTPH